MTFADILAVGQERPVAVALELGSVVVCFGLVVALFVAFAMGPPAEAGTGLWIAIVSVGAGFVVFWTVLWPLWSRFRYRE